MIHTRQFFIDHYDIVKKYSYMYKICDRIMNDSIMNVLINYIDLNSNNPQEKRTIGLLIVYHRLLNILSKRLYRLFISNEYRGRSRNEPGSLNEPM
jgi:hypothetical protein